MVLSSPALVVLRALAFSYHEAHEGHEEKSISLAKAQRTPRNSQKKYGLLCGLRVLARKILCLLRNLRDLRALRG
ncbi:hypothetical protein [Thioalkalivibrio denitrificans]|uniref:hypothetical protein n=1 Tax=Thioalkalivibrio denitrificans TaxID=108003 RepID=UPI001C37643D|nr:hypothetical protein [Thioalkalivibrio denitrificans]